MTASFVTSCGAGVPKPIQVKSQLLHHQFSTVKMVWENSRRRPKYHSFCVHMRDLEESMASELQRGPVLTGEGNQQINILSLSPCSSITLEIHI